MRPPRLIEQLVLEPAELAEAWIAGGRNGMTIAPRDLAEQRAEQLADDGLRRMLVAAAFVERLQAREQEAAGSAPRPRS